MRPFNSLRVDQRRILSQLKEDGVFCVHGPVWSSMRTVWLLGSYRSGGVALIDGVFEVCAQLIKGNNLKTEQTEKLSDEETECVSVRTWLHIYNVQMQPRTTPMFI